MAINFDAIDKYYATPYNTQPEAIQAADRQTAAHIVEWFKKAVMLYNMHNLEASQHIATQHIAPLSIFHYAQDKTIGDWFDLLASAKECADIYQITPLQDYLFSYDRWLTDLRYVAQMLNQDRLGDVYTALSIAQGHRYWVSTLKQLSGFVTGQHAETIAAHSRICT